MLCCSCCSFDEEKKKKKKKKEKKKKKKLQNLRSIISSCKKESKFSWVVSCMAIVELQFGVSCDSFCPFFAEHLPYHVPFV